MTDYDGFKEHIKKAVEAFKHIPAHETIRLVSHLDADGISAAAIMVKALNQENRKYSLSILHQLKTSSVQELALEPYNYVIFSDIGSGQLKAIGELLKDKKVIVLDHHKPESAEWADNIMHVNPHLFGIDGGREISGSGVVYMFCSMLNKELEALAHIAIIGAIGDVQENNGFHKLNDEILQKAIALGKIEVKKGLRVFGAETRPLHKVLEYCSDPYIPDVSGSEGGAIQFLNHLGINPKHEKGWKKLGELNQEEYKKLIAGIVMKRIDEDNPSDVLGNMYVLLDEKEGSETRYCKEFATLLNSCGRMGKASWGIGACLNDKKTKAKAVQNLVNYRREIMNAINWYSSNKNSKNIVKGHGYMVINAESNIMGTIIGTLASIVARQSDIKPGTLILSLAQLEDGNSKASMRIAGYGNKDKDLRSIIKEITAQVPGCEAGGHMQAAGALVPGEKEEEFLAAAQEVLERYAMEEKIKS